jgi:hypothetical protein
LSLKQDLVPVGASQQISTQITFDTFQLTAPLTLLGC